jgi:2,3-diaminopropionate biosynthesis protein SbnB
MLYLNQKDINAIGINWIETISVIEETVKCIEKNDYSQPVKPYLRYKNMNNRIIAMPAFVGGSIDIAGIKWISSFPDNINHGFPRAHSILILNDAYTGEVIAAINTNLLSIVRTVSVTGLIMKHYNNIRNPLKFNIGIIGLGPIGKYHLKMFMELFRDKISNVFLYDIRGIDKECLETEFTGKIRVFTNWQDAYKDADIVITCTTANRPYIDRPPKKGSLQLNISLRDYKTDIYDFVSKPIIVDNWEEVCRENTDIEMMYKYKGLKKEETLSIVDVVCKEGMTGFTEDDVIMFNPMGLAVFDIAIGKYYADKAKKYKLGNELV